MEVYQTAGPRLNVRSSDVHLELVRRALLSGIAKGERIVVKFSADEFLGSIGKSRGLTNRKWLSEELARLKRASFRLEAPGLKRWEFSHINDFTEDGSKRDTKSSAQYEVELNAKLVEVFKATGWAFLRGRVRATLLDAKDLLGRALYGYYASYQHKPPKKSAAEMKVLFGCEARQNSRWLDDLRTSLANVKAATGWYHCHLDESGKEPVIVVHKDKAQAAIQMSTTKGAGGKKVPPKDVGWVPPIEPVEEPRTVDGWVTSLRDAELAILSSRLGCLFDPDYEPREDLEAFVLESGKELAELEELIADMDI